MCIASGPSHRPEDGIAVRSSGLPSIVTNTMYQACPWADALFAFDMKWMRKYNEDVKACFGGRRFSASHTATKFGFESLAQEKWFHRFGNSGSCAISMALSAGAKRILLLGYDCQRTNGKTHSHGDHPRELSNALSMVNWPGDFGRLQLHVSRHHAGVEIINCSRESALRQWPRLSLEDALAQAESQV